MQHDMPAPTFGGIDWATDSNEVCVVDNDGRVLARESTTADAAGIRRLIATLRRFAVALIAIERPDGPVVDALLAAEMAVTVIAPRQVKNLRDRYGSTGNKDDRFDAFVLADTARTDRQRLRLLEADSPQTQALRSIVRARGDLVEARVGLCNQLRAHLRGVFPGAVGLFADLDSPISLAFLTRFPTAGKAAWLGPARLASWLRAQSYSGRTDAQVLLDRLHGAPAGLDRDAGDVAGHTTAAYVSALLAIRGQIDALDKRVAEQLAVHPDAEIFQSLPRAGTVRAAKLLVEIGDARAKFPTNDALAALGGVTPSTRRSGRLHVVTYRWACNKKLRDALTDFAADSRHSSPWAADIYDRHRTAGKSHQHATRILARAWIRVIWACWQNNTPYDPANHRGANARTEAIPMTA